MTILILRATGREDWAAIMAAAWAYDLEGDGFLGGHDEANMWWDCPIYVPDADAWDGVFDGEWPNVGAEGVAGTDLPVRADHVPGRPASV